MADKPKTTRHAKTVHAWLNKGKTPWAMVLIKAGYWKWVRVYGAGRRGGGLKILTKNGFWVRAHDVCEARP